jgi:hypothetical protein
MFNEKLTMCLEQSYKDNSMSKVDVILGNNHNNTNTCYNFQKQPHMQCVGNRMISCYREMPWLEDQMNNKLIINHVYNLHHWFQQF